MGARVIIHALGGFLAAATIVYLFSPETHSLWGDAFFGIPFSLAMVAVPGVAALCAAWACAFDIHHPLSLPRPIWIRALRISLYAFFVYSACHVVAYTCFAIQRAVDLSGLGWALAEGIGFGFALLFFGTMCFWPLLFAVATFCEWVSSHVAP
jgi:hypothetical protein